MNQDEQDEMNFITAITKLGWMLLFALIGIGVIFAGLSYVLNQAKIHHEAIHSTTTTPYH